MTTPLETVGKQVESAVKNQIRGAQAEVLRETSIVRQANARLGAVLRNGEHKAKAKRNAASRSGVYVEGRPAQTGPDGYVRRSPVQALRVAPDYRKRCLKRAVGAVIGILVLCGIGLLLIKYLF